MEMQKKAMFVLLKGEAPQVGRGGALEQKDTAKG